MSQRGSPSPGPTIAAIASFERMTAWYRAHDRFVRLLRDARHHFTFRLRAGDVLLYDNWRMLHGRAAFAGPRWVRGVCFDPVGGDTVARDVSASPGLAT